LGAMRTYPQPWTNARWDINPQTGHGLRVLESGSWYEGTFCEGIPHGAGTEVWPDGRQYKGSYTDGWLHGQGRESWPKLNTHYTGGFVKGMHDVGVFFLFFFSPYIQATVLFHS
jgi:hypothetical protein